MASENTAFLNLIKAYGESAGLPVSPDARGLEFEGEGLTLSIIQDPRQHARLLARIECGALDEDLDSVAEAKTALFLHQLNSAACFEHDWVITVDPARTVHLHSQHEIARTTTTDLEHLLADAMARGQALQEALTGMQTQAAPEKFESLSATDWHMSSIIRG